MAPFKGRVFAKGKKGRSYSRGIVLSEMTSPILVWEGVG